jgi:hypothetical protein
MPIESKQKSQPGQGPESKDHPVSFHNGGNRLNVFPNRVEHGLFLSIKTHFWDEIASAEAGGFILDFQLQLADGTKPDGQNIGWQRSKQAADEINKRVAAFRQQMQIGKTDAALLCTALGGSNAGVDPGTRCSVYFTEKTIRVFSKSILREEIDVANVSGIELGGPGKTSTGGGFIGGGFGFEGAVEGMGAAAILNALTTKSEINTLLRVSAHGKELFFHSGSMAPADARIRLSPTFTSMKANEAHQRPPTPSRSIAEELKDLSEMRASGHLTDDEFATAKKRLLG